MRVSLWKIGVAALLGSAVFGSPCFAQESLANDAASGPYRIAGHIVSAIDGHALQRATVSIQTTKTNRPVASVVADEDGAFAFPGVKAGAYVLIGKSTGYLTSRYQEHRGFSTAIVTGAGVDTESLLLKLTPDGEIHGRITDESGEAVRHAQVSLYFERHDASGAHINRMRTAQTDDNGEYALANLAPGKYFVSVSGRPWYAVHPQPARQSNQFDGPAAYPSNQVQAGTGLSFGVVDSLDPTLDVAYPITFYPDATDAASAAPIQLKPGDQTGIDIRLNPEPAVTLTIPRDPGRNPQDDRPMQVEKLVFNDLEMIQVEQIQTSPGEFTIAGLAPGHYVLKEFPSPAGGPARALNVDLSGKSTQVDPAQGSSLGSVKVLLKSADGAKLPAQVQVSLYADNASVASTWSNNKQEAQITGVTPGDYRFVVSGGQRPFTVTEVLVDGKPQSNRWHVGDGATASATLLLRAGKLTVQGFAQQAGKPAAGVLVLLVPASEPRNPESTRIQQSDLDGSFDLTNIPPGSYTLLAIDDAWELEWQHPDVLARYLPKGTPLTLPETASNPIRLPDPLEVQPR